MTSYNLLTEPWIPVMDGAGNIKNMGIVDTLKESYSLIEVSDSSPLVQFGVYRLLIAFVMDALELKNERGLAKAIERKQFDPEVIDSYAEKWKNRFDLFDKEQPFMQSPENASLETEKVPIHFLLLHISPSYNNQFLYHGLEDSHAFSSELCARGLVAIPPFITAGGRGYSPSINGSPPLYILVKGDNMFQTILYNTCVIDPIVKPTGNEPPAWRSDMKVEPGKETFQFSLLEGLTWRPRRIRLLPGKGGVCTYSGRVKESLVSEMYFGPGLKAAGEWADPQIAYRFTSKGRSPIRPEESREPWRDIGPLALLHKDEYCSDNGKVRYEQPTVVTQYKKLVEDGAISNKKPLMLELYGIRTETGKMKVFEWTIERLSLSWDVMYIKNVDKQVQNAIDCAEIVARNIGWAIKKAYPRNGEGNKNALGYIIENATFAYWSSVKQQFMEWFLKELSSQQSDKPLDPDAPQRLLNQWKEIIVKEGIRCLDIAIDPLDTNAKELERRVQVRNSYWRDVKSQLYPETHKKKSMKGGKQSNGI